MRAQEADTIGVQNAEAGYGGYGISGLLDLIAAYFYYSVLKRAKHQKSLP